MIRLNIHRYRCPDCGYVFPDEFTFYEKNEHITKRLKQEFVKRCIGLETFRHIAKDYSVDGKTVAKAFNEYADTHRDKSVLTYTPEILGIDEAHIDDNFRLVVTDILNKKLLDIKKNNNSNTVKAYLRTLDKSICKCVTMDFAEHYAYCVKAVLPKAIIVIDKYHVIQDIGRCVDRVRINLQNHYRKLGYDIRIFKSSKRLFGTNWEDLTPNGMDKLNEWFKAFPELYEAYMVKQTFRDIYATAKTHSEALVMYDAWLNAIPNYEEFNPIRTTFRKRRDHITNYWHYHWTNAFTESTNNSIKDIEKRGRGYKFDVLRDRCMLSINNPKPEKFSHKKVVYVKKSDNPTVIVSNEKLYELSLQYDKLNPLRCIDDASPEFTDEENTFLDYVQNIGRMMRNS